MNLRRYSQFNRSHSGALMDTKLDFQGDVVAYTSITLSGSPKRIPSQPRPQARRGTALPTEPPVEIILQAHPSKFF